MASIIKKVNRQGITKYYSDISINKKRIRRYLGLSLSTAKLKLKKLEYELLFKPQTNNKRQYKLQNATLSFLSNLEVSGVSKLHLNNIKGKIKAFINYCATNRKFHINDITPEIANRFIIHRSNQRVLNKYHSKFDDYLPKLTPTTLNKDIQTMKRMYSYFIDMEWIETNPFRNIRKFKIISKQRYHFTSEQIKLIMNNAGKFYEFYYFLLYTGIRATDAYALKAKHFEDNYIKLKMNKTGDFLNIPIPNNVLEVISYKLSNYIVFSNLITSKQRRNCVKNIQRLFEPDFVRKNNINLHTFRHTYAHNMLNKGVPKEVLQTLLGHRSIKTTEIYANWVRKEELEKWV